MNRKTKLIISMALLAVLAAACAQPTPGPANMPNPASANCVDQGGTVEIRTDEQGGQYGVCIFADGSECEEWAYFRGECQPGEAGQVPSPESLPSYINDQYGFSFNPASAWAIEGYADHLIFRQPGYAVFVGYQWAGEEPKPFRTGMPQGEFVDGGTAMLLGQSIPKRILVWEGKNKLVDYGGRIKAGDLILVFYLDGTETPEELSYDEINLTPEMIAAAEELIASFALTSGETPTLEFNP